MPASPGCAGTGLADNLGASHGYTRRADRPQPTESTVMIDAFFALALMLLSLAAAGYAQLRLSYHSATRRQALISRLILIVVGIAFGWTVMIWTIEPAPVWNAVSFLTGFGLVHVPAAAILYIKRRRGIYR